MGASIRVSIAAEQTRTRPPETSKPQFPFVCVGGAMANRLVFQNIAPSLTPAQEAAKYFAETQYEAAAIEPPHIPYPAPQPAKQPWTPHRTYIVRQMRQICFDGKRTGSRNVTRQRRTRYRRAPERRRPGVSLGHGGHLAKWGLS